APRSYTVEPGKALVGEWPLTALGLNSADVSVHGPNGFFRRFKGSVTELTAAQLDIKVTYDGNAAALDLAITHQASTGGSLVIADGYAGSPTNLTVEGGKTATKRFPLGKSNAWYDLRVTMAAKPSIEYQLAGHVETGKDSTSDPLLG